MDVAVKTGTTKAAGGTSLVSLSFPGSNDEQAFLLLHITASPHDSKTIEEESTGIIHHALLESEGEAWHRLDGTLKELNGLFKGFLASGTMEDVHGLLGLIDGAGTLHVSHAGRSEAYLVRRGATSQITEYSKGKPVPMFVHISSGPLEPRDVVVGATQRLLRTLTPAQLAQLTQRGDQCLDEVTLKLDAEQERSALVTLQVAGRGAQSSLDEAPTKPSRLFALGTRRKRRQGWLIGITDWLSTAGSTLFEKAASGLQAARVPSRPNVPSSLTRVSSFFTGLQPHFRDFLMDLKDPKRKRRAHLMLLASALAVFLLIWAIVRLTTFSQNSKTQAELQQLVEQINTDIQAVDNKRITGDIDSANAILGKAEDRAKQVMDSSSGLFRVQALDLLDKIRAKREEILNIVRVTPRTVVNVATKNAAITAQGLIGIADGEFAVYDRQDLYRVLLNSIEDPRRISDEELLIDGASFARFKSLVFLTNGNSVIEYSSNQPVTMKTEDPAGWMKGKDLETYLRFLYILSPDNNQIYKYERLNNRYTTPVGYNVNGDLKGAIDMTIDGAVYVLKDGGQVIKLFRGEAKPFLIRHAPDNVLQNTEKVFKVPGENLYFLDPTRSRIVVVSDGGDTGEASYVRQYLVEGVGRLQDFTVDTDESRMYLMDEKKIYAIDIVK